MQAWVDAHLPGLGTQTRRWLLDAAAVAAYHAQTEWPVVRLLICDGALQFTVAGVTMRLHLKHLPGLILTLALLAGCADPTGGPAAGSSSPATEASIPAPMPAWSTPSRRPARQSPSRPARSG